jgi:phenylpyruvate tautomerase PptA (4-oxalocrotonate tautomerase family)
MPFVRIETNQTADAATSGAIVKSVTDLVAQVKPEVERRGIAVSLHHNCVLSFGGDAAAPAVVINVTNATMPHEVTLPLTKGLTEIAKQHYGADPVRIYVFFHELKELYLVGIMGVTFAELGAGAAAPHAAPPAAPLKA